MKIKTTQTDLKAALAKLATVIPPNPAVPILSCVRLSGSRDGKELSLLGTNLNVTAKTKLSCAVEEPSVAIVSYKLLSGVVNASNAGVIAIETGGGKMTITTPTGKSRIAMMAENLFPPINREADKEVSYVVKSDALARMLSQVEFAIADKSDGRKNLESVLVEFVEDTVRVVATNGKALALARGKIEQGGSPGVPFSVIVPDTAVRLVSRLLDGEGDVVICTHSEKKYVIFSSAGAVVQTKLVDGAYPDYTRVIPGDSEHHALVSSALVASAIRRVSVFLEGTDCPHVEMEFGGNALTVTSQRSEVGSSCESVTIEEYTANPVKMKFAPGLVRSALDKPVHDKVKVELYGEFQPIKISDGDEYMAIVMPMRIS